MPTIAAAPAQTSNLIFSSLFNYFGNIFFLFSFRNLHLGSPSLQRCMTAAKTRATLSLAGLLLAEQIHRGRRARKSHRHPRSRVRRCRLICEGAAPASRCQTTARTPPQETDSCCQDATSRGETDESRVLSQPPVKGCPTLHESPASLINQLGVCFFFTLAVFGSALTLSPECLSNI